jgi:hypothetical protein
MKETLLYTRQELNIRDRIERIQKVVAQDETTTADILRAEYGTDRINGLDIKALPNLPVVITPLEQAPYVLEMDDKERTAYMRHIAGSASGGPNINLQQSYIDALRTPYRLDRETLPGMAERSSIIGHENAHRLQFMLKDNGWFPVAEYATDRALHVMSANTGPVDTLKNLVLKARQYVVDYNVHRLTGEKVSDYYAQPVEIQARLHEIMVAGYAQWGKLPASKTELQAALYNAGVDMPLRTKWQIMTSAEGLRALHDFRCSPPVVAAMAVPVKGINNVVDFAVLSTRRALLWDKIFPQQYGHLIEMYGDGPGRERMGLGPNPAPVIAAARVVTGATPIPAEQAQALAASIPPAWARQFFNSMIKQPELTDNQRTMMSALLARPETRDAIIGGDAVDRNLVLDDAPLQNALYSGNADTVEMLLAAGCDPLLRVPCRWLDGTTSHLLSLAEFPGLIRHLESNMARGAAGFSDKFNEESYRAHTRESLAKIDKAMGGMVRHYGDQWMETAPLPLRGVVAFARDRQADAARHEALPLPAGPVTTGMTADRT